ASISRALRQSNAPGAISRSGPLRSAPKCRSRLSGERSLDKEPWLPHLYLPLRCRRDAFRRPREDRSLLLVFELLQVDLDGRRFEFTRAFVQDSFDLQPDTDADGLRAKVQFRTDVLKIKHERGVSSDAVTLDFESGGRQNVGDVSANRHVLWPLRRGTTRVRVRLLATSLLSRFVRRRFGL